MPPAPETRFARAGDVDIAYQVIGRDSPDLLFVPGWISNVEIMWDLPELIRYLTEWRMHLAEDLLANTDAGVATVARRVAYDSEEAFIRAFKRARGLSPSHWRVARQASAAP